MTNPIADRIINIPIGARTKESHKTNPRKAYFAIIPIVTVQKYLLLTKTGVKRTNKTSIICPAAKGLSVPKY
ncbi:hypothetical protein RA276_29880, partial [Pseudomonas syringae pv. tagetis]